MELNTVINEAATLAAAYSDQSLAPQIERVREISQQKEIKIVVMGDTKAGKSSFINRVFLRRDILPIGLLETTAVPVELRSGAPLMQVWSRDDSVGSGTCTEEKSDFTGEDIARFVTADTAEQRAAHAEKYSKVCVRMPDILPSGMTVIDTPGLNTPNSAIYVSTMREARSAHAILYFVRGKQLGEREVLLLADLAGMQQPSLPIYVVLTLTQGQYEPGHVEDLCKEISAQLADVGMPHTKVSAFYPDTDDEQPTLRQELQSFLSGDVQRGLDARIARDLRPLLLQLDTSLKARMELSGKGEREIAEIRLAAEKKKEDYKRLVRVLLEQIADAQASGLAALDEKLNELSAAFEADMAAKSSVAEILGAIKIWQESLPQALRHLLSLVLEDLKKDIARIGDEFKVSLEANPALPVIENTLGSSDFLRILSAIPRWVLVALDLSLSVLILPTGLLTDIAIRLLAGFLPFVREILPINIAGSLARKIAVGEFAKVMSETRSTVARDMKKNFEDVNRKLSTDLNDIPLFKEFEVAVDLAEKGLLSPTEKEKIRKDSERVAAWFDSLYGQQLPS